MSKRQLGVGWGVEAESRDTEVLNGDGSALSAATMKRRGVLLVFIGREVRNTRCSVRMEQLHDNKSPTPHINF